LQLPWACCAKTWLFQGLTWLFAMNNQSWFPKNMHEVHILLSVHVKVHGHPEWASYLLFCFCDAAAQTAPGPLGKQAFFVHMSTVLTTRLNVLDASGTSLLYLCCPFCNTVCARSRLIVAMNTQA
jgi:hypothetical protein